MLFFKTIYYERKIEIDSFLNLMVFLEGKNETKAQDGEFTQFQLFFDAKDGNTPISYLSMINIMKSNVALMLYNIIEYTVSGLLDTIHADIKKQKLCYTDVNPDIQSLWRKTVLGKMKDPCSNYNTFLEIGELMVSHIIQEKTLDLGARDLLTGGNLDGVVIDRILASYGIPFNPQKANFRPDKLSYIKTKRNDLTHGSISFSDALRDIAIKDIVEDKDIIFSFLEDLIGIISDYKTNKKYKCAN